MISDVNARNSLANFSSFLLKSSLEFFISTNIALTQQVIPFSYVNSWSDGIESLALIGVSDFNILIMLAFEFL